MANKQHVQHVHHCYSGPLYFLFINNNNKPADPLLKNLNIQIINYVISPNAHGKYNSKVHFICSFKCFIQFVSFQNIANAKQKNCAEAKKSHLCSKIAYYSIESDISSDFLRIY